MNSEFNIIFLVTWYVVFIISTTIHEACHAWIGKRGGDLTAFHGGQVSLDPTPHIRREPFGMIVVPIISLLLMGWPLGFASVPYDPVWAQQNPRKSAYMSLAGPTGNLLLLIMAGILIRVGILLGWFLPPEAITITHICAATSDGALQGLSIILSMFFIENLVLFIFNMIPLPPLDGSEIITLFFNPKHIDRYHQFINNPAMSFIGIFVAWQVFDLIFSTFYTISLNILYPGAHYA